jgi:penicillin amidase
LNNHSRDIETLAKGGDMSAKFLRVLFSIIGVLLGLVIILGVVGIFLARSSFPKVSGELTVNGLENSVDIFRDSYGVPNIYAQTTHDLFFAQGYVHAQDRFWQMDFWRHIGSGRLSEMFGKDQLDTDTFLRTMGWARVGQQELDAMSADELAVLQAYADGVNAYLADHKGTALSLEYAVLKLLNSGYSPEPWQPLNTITWAKAMAWDLGSSRLDSEVEHAILMKTLSSQQISDLFPPYPADHPVVVPNLTQGAVPGASTVQAEGLQALADLYPAFRSLLTSISKVEALLGPTGNGIGSNNWVIAGSRTSTGKPFLANDMHLSEQMPSIWYEIGLHCSTLSADCPYNVAGFSFAGVPGVIVGHTDRIAWGFTNVGPDVLDLYIEKINPDNPNQYEVNGQWVDMTLVHETIQVAGSTPVDLTVRYTRHGPIIWDDPTNHTKIQDSWGIDLPTNFAISMRWTALEPVNVIITFLGLDKAKNFQDFRQAASFFAVPSQNMVYADVDGNIGYQTPGNIPIRLPGHGGDYPVPGWTDDYEWQGYIPFDQLPNAFNPSEGYIVSANNAVVGPDYPYLITDQWDYGFRAERIVQMIQTAPGPIDAAYIQTMHGDDYNASAAYIVPLLMQLPLQDEHLIAIRDLLNGWDYQDQMDLTAPAVYNAFWRATLAATFQDDLPEDYWPDGGDVWFEIMRKLVQSPDSAWWDDKNTSAVETRDDILQTAFTEVVAELENLLGKNSSRWTWGDMHILIFHNQSLGTSGVAPIEAIFNRGPYRTSGGNSIVNATAWDAAETEPAKAYQVVWLPSERLIVDLSDLPASQSVITTGESGHTFHRNYADQSDLWRNIQYHPMLWDQPQVESNAKDHLILTP